MSQPRLPVLPTVSGRALELRQAVAALSDRALDRLLGLALAGRVGEVEEAIRPRPSKGRRAA